jgi:hypothetical protein
MDCVDIAYDHWVLLMPCFSRLLVRCRLKALENLHEIFVYFCEPYLRQDMTPPSADRESIYTFFGVEKVIF